MASKALLKAVTTPSRVASLLESSKGTRPLLTLEIQRHRIGMAVIWNPLGGDHAVEWLPDITLPSDSLIHKEGCNTTSTRGKLSIETYSRRIPQEWCRELASTIRSYNVCAVIVGWPVQKDTGKIGGPCGRVLYTLESILDWETSTSEKKISAPMLSPNRPLCFWTRRSVLEFAPTDGDEWGRCPAYGKPSSPKKVHLASTEQYAFDETAQATDLWEDFWKMHWPVLYNRRKQTKKTNSASSTSGTNLVADWRNAPSYLTSHVII